MDLSPDALGALCAQRADALRGRAWRNDAERDALREETACLLRVVACRLGGQIRLRERDPADADAVRDYLATHVEHRPLAARGAGATGLGPGESEPGAG
jgi:hypothetical protein